MDRLVGICATHAALLLEFRQGGLRFFEAIGKQHIQFADMSFRLEEDNHPVTS